MPAGGLKRCSESPGWSHCFVLFLYSFISSFIRQNSLSSSCVPSSLLHMGNIAENTIEKSVPRGVYIPVGETGNKLDK